MMEKKRSGEKAVAFVVARLSSSRMPAKHLRSIGDRSMLTWVVDQLRTSTQVDRVVLATVAEPENRPLQGFAEKNGIDFFWYEGEVDHVTTRLRTAAEMYQADICILVSGDCPLIFAPAIDQMILALKNDIDADTVRLPNDTHGQPPALQGILVNRKTAWQRADDLADRPELKEHQFPVLGQRPELFHPIDVHLSPHLYMPHHRLSVDTLADLDFMNSVFDALEKKGVPFLLPETIALLADRPELKDINGHVHQRRLVEKIKKVLFVVDSGGDFGFGHLMRSMELARQITERLSWPTHFMVDDPRAAKMIEKMGCKCHWGALGRPFRTDDRDPSVSLPSILSSYDLLIIDIFDQRGPEPGWRSRMQEGSRCVVMENQQPWTMEADMVVMPNVLGKYPMDGRDGENLATAGDRGTLSEPRIVAGERFIILRDEIRRIAAHPTEKSLDVLVYLHDGRRRKTLNKIFESMKIEVKIIKGFSENFHGDLASARIFISGFGVGFNEAMAVQTLPVCWPDSTAHRDDAARFYSHFGMQPLLIDSPEDIQPLISSCLNGQIKPPVPLQDGTPSIVKEISALFDSTHAQAPA